MAKRKGAFNWGEGGGGGILEFVSGKKNGGLTSLILVCRIDLSNK